MNEILVFLWDLFQINYQTFKTKIIQIGQVFLEILKKQQSAVKRELDVRVSSSPWLKRQLSYTKNSRWSDLCRNQEYRYKFTNII